MPSYARKPNVGQGDKRVFISPSADELEQSAIREYGTLVDGGIATLVNRIKTVRENYETVSFATALLSLLEVLPDTPSGTRPNAEKLAEQLVFGRLPEGEVLHREEVFPGQPYLVLRKQDKEAIDALRRGPWRDLLFVGELASGKTASALNITAHLLEEGYRVFYASKGETLIDELTWLAGRDEKICVVFENYASMREAIRDYINRRKQGHRVILTERAVVHGFVSEFIDKTNHLGPVFEVSLDRIAAEDIPLFEALVNFSGFWGERAGASESARQRIIADRLDGSLYKLLIEIIRSEKVQAEVRKLLEPITYDRRVMKIFISSFIVNALGFRFSINDWQSVFDGQWVRRVMRTYTEQVHHFLRIEGDSIFPRAGLLSSHILRTFAEDDLVRECLVDLYERSSRSEDHDPEFRSLRMALTTYGSIEPIFSDRKKGANIFRYYDDIRVFGSTRNNADYWLQVGIAATIYDDLDRAEKAFGQLYT